MTQQTTDPQTGPLTGPQTGPQTNPGNGDAPLEPFAQELIPPEQELPENLKEMVERAIVLHREIRDMETQVKQHRAELQRLDPVIIEHFAAAQLQQQKMKTGETVYLEKSTYTSLVADANGNHNAAHQALIDYGPQWLVKDKVDSSSLSAWVREQRRDEIEIHEDLIPFLKISDVYRVKVRL